MTQCLLNAGCSLWIEWCPHSNTSGQVLWECIEGPELNKIHAHCLKFNFRTSLWVSSYLLSDCKIPCPYRQHSPQPRSIQINCLLTAGRTEVKGSSSSPICIYGLRGQASLFYSSCFCINDRSTFLSSSLWTLFPFSAGSVEPDPVAQNWRLCSHSCTHCIYPW